MTTYIALLRGINVGGKRKVPMAALRTAFVDLGFADARTLLNSGNVVFGSRRKMTTAALETFLETGIARQLGLQTEFHVRTADEWRAMIDANPLPEVAARHPAGFIALCMKVVPAPEAVEALRAANRGPEIILAVGRHLYIDYSVLGMGISPLTPALMVSRLGTRGTGRNWNTVLKLAAMVAAPGERQK